MTFFLRAYHGHSVAMIDVSPYKFKKLGEEHKQDYIHVCPCPDPYRGIHQGDDLAHVSELYSAEMKKTISDAHEKGRKV